MVLAHQHLGELPPDLRQAVLANARSKVVFQTSAEDARTFAREFGRRVDDQDFMQLGSYEVICRLACGDGVSAPVTAVTQPPVPPTDLAREVRMRSRQTYGRPIAEVEAAIEQRRGGPEAASPRPKTGPQPWV